MAPTSHARGPGFESQLCFQSGSLLMGSWEVAEVGSSAGTPATRMGDLDGVLAVVSVWGMRRMGDHCLSSPKDVFAQCTFLSGFTLLRVSLLGLCGQRPSLFCVGLALFDSHCDSEQASGRADGLAGERGGHTSQRAGGPRAAHRSKWLFLAVVYPRLVSPPARPIQNVSRAQGQ